MDKSLLFLLLVLAVGACHTSKGNDDDSGSA